MVNEFIEKVDEETVKITDEGIEKVENFIKKESELYLLINLYILNNLFDMLHEELSEEDFKRIKGTIEGGL